MDIVLVVMQKLRRLRYRAEKKKWQKYYAQAGVEADFMEVRVPWKPRGNWRLLFIVRNLTIDTLLENYTKILRRYNPRWDVRIYGPEGVVQHIKDVRTAIQHYAVWVQDRLEADLETLGQPVREVDPRGRHGITLLEHLIHGYVEWIERHEHLGRKGPTLCSGSRVRMTTIQGRATPLSAQDFRIEEKVPYVEWDGGVVEGVVISFCWGRSTLKYGGIRRVAS